MSTLRGKKYGLILPSKKTNAPNKLAKPSVFGDSSSDEEVGMLLVTRANIWRKISKAVHVCHRPPPLLLPHSLLLLS